MERGRVAHKPGADFERDQWLLFDTAADFSESTDVSGRYPEKVAELKALWLAEASKYSKPPLKEVSRQVESFRLYDDAFAGPEGEKPR